MTGENNFLGNFMSASDGFYREEALRYLQEAYEKQMQGEIASVAQRSSPLGSLLRNDERQK